MDQKTKDPNMDPINNRSAKDPYKELPIKDFSYVNNSKHSALKKSRVKPLILVICLLLVVALGAGAYIGLSNRKPKAVPKPTTSSSSKSTNKTTAVTKAPSIPTTAYTSTGFNLSVNYPTSWVISDNGTTALNITSPITTLTADTGKSVQGKIIVTVQPKGQIPPAFGMSGSVAVLNSQLITYASPTASQAAQTYISFVQYPTTTVLGGMDGIYVTGNNGYLKDQNIPNSDITDLDPLVTVTFQECQTSTCTNLTDLTISSAEWSNLNFSTPILDTLKSFSFS